MTEFDKDVGESFDDVMHLFQYSKVVEKAVEYALKSVICGSHKLDTACSNLVVWTQNKI